MNRQEFRETLHHTLVEILADRITVFMDQRFDNYRQISRYFSALDRKSADTDILKESLPSILKAVDKAVAREQEKSFVDIYISAVAEVNNQFPSQVEWEQTEERFTVQEDDSIFISAVKYVKGILRRGMYGWHTAKERLVSLVRGSVESRQSWLQAIPIQNAVCYHLLEKKTILGWLHELNRSQLNCLLDIEAFVTNFENHPEDKEGKNFDDFAKQLEQVIDKKQQQIKQDIAHDLDRLEEQILESTQKAGTIEGNKRRYRDDQIESRKDNVQQQLQTNGKKWDEAQQLVSDHIKLVVNFIRLQNDFGEQCEKLQEDLEIYFQNLLEQPLQELEKMLESGKQSNSSAKLYQLKEQVAEHLNVGIITPVKQSIDQQIFSSKVEHFLENILRRANQEPEEKQLVYKRDLEPNPPEIKFRSIDWQLMVVRSVRKHFVTGIQQVEKEFSDFLSSVLNELQKIEEIVEVNLESAIAAENEDTTKEDEDSAAIANEALERLLGNVVDLQKQSEQKRQQFTEVAGDGYEALRSSLRSLVIDGQVQELQLLNAKYRAQEKTKGWKTALDSRLARAQDRLSVWTRFAWRKGEKAILAVNTFLGFHQKSLKESKRADIASYLSETDRKLQELPYIYRRLFNFDAVADQRFYVPVIDSAATFRKAYGQWQNALPTTFAVVGEKGSGKSTFLNLILVSEVTEHSLIEVKMDETIWSEQKLVELLSEPLELSDSASVEDLITHINSWDERKVIVIESVQNCFIRNINGYEAIEKLCYLISETKKQVFWVMSCSRYGWRFLDKTVQLSEYVSHLTTTDTLDASQIKKIIFNRHRSSGYSLYFEPGDEAEKSRNYRKLKDQEEEAQEYLQEDYFKELTELAEGNASVAMIFWIRSIREFDDTHCYIQPLEITSLRMIENLSNQVLFALAAFVLHDTLTAADLAMVLNITKEKGRLLANRLLSRGLLVEEGEEYGINHLMYRQIVRVLKDRNIIHLV